MRKKRSKKAGVEKIEQRSRSKHVIIISRIILGRFTHFASLLVQHTAYDCLRDYIVHQHKRNKMINCIDACITFVAASVLCSKSIAAFLPTVETFTNRKSYIRIPTNN